MLWVLSIANIFVYIARYAMVDWGPTYLKEVKGASLAEGGFSTLVIEFAGAAGMLTMGWLSDKLGGRRARVSVMAMIPLLVAFAAIRVTPKGMLWLDMTLFAVIGFFVYTPVMFSGVMSLDLTTKKAVGTAAGFVGFFGYVGRVIQGKGLGWVCPALRLGPRALGRAGLHRDWHHPAGLPLERAPPRVTGRRSWVGFVWNAQLAGNSGLSLGAGHFALLYCRNAWSCLGCVRQKRTSRENTRNVSGRRWCSMTSTSCSTVSGLKPRSWNSSVSV